MTATSRTVAYGNVTAFSDPITPAPTAVRYVIDEPRIDSGGHELTIQATLRPASVRDVWAQTAMEGLPLASGAVHFVIEDARAHTEVLDDELFGMVSHGDSLLIYRPLTGEERSDPWVTDEPVWLRLVEAFKQATGTQDRSEQGEVARLASDCQQLSGLSDRQLAELFPGEVARETFNRWRNGSLRTPTPGNLHRLNLLCRYIRDVAERTSEPRTWLLSPIEGRDTTPYDLLKAGRLDEAENLLWSLARPGEPSPGEVFSSHPLRSDDRTGSWFEDESVDLDVEVEEGNDF